ncbi:DUF4214 domain-containing protein [Sulfitobacter sp. S0837]|uniref:DUF4214 domain-containing protein n=1 Tax=Sulfitobacter maritimus TaxID=2741719 RepID=UPI0015813CDA|nr:DUF4214 domain-containing protein [Sulfitobacter maritimus]NUH63772.1 DUF4214 domain-containing protein [Sulfitobacter maritimus]
MFTKQELNMATLEQKQDLAALYIGYFDRAPDPDGLQFWIDQIDNGREFNTIAADFASSDEAEALYPFLTTPGVSTPNAFVTSIYVNLFGRVPEQEGLDFWTGVLADGSVSAGDMVEKIIMGARDDVDLGTSDKSVLDNKIEVGLDWAESVANVPGFEFDAAAKAAAVASVNGVTEDEATVEAAKQATDDFVGGAANPGDTFTLTTGSDNFVGTSDNDKFNAGVEQDGAGNLVQTLQGVDQLDGGLGIDTLNVTLNGTNVAPSLTSIEVVNVRAAAGTTLNLGSSTGVTNVNVAGSTAVARLANIGAAELGVSNQTQSVTVSGSTATELKLNLDTVGTAATDINLNLAALSANAATSYDIAAKDAHVTILESVASAATTSASIAATGANELTFSAADLASLTSLTVTGDGSLDLGAGAFTAVTTVAAADHAGGLTVTVDDTATAVNTGAGEDAVTVSGNLGATQKINTGAGDDMVSVTGNLTAGALIDGGEGVDTIGLTSTVASGATNDVEEKTFSNFEALAITDALAGSINLANLDDLQTVNLRAGVNGNNTISGLNTGATVNFGAAATATTDVTTIAVTGAGVQTTDVLNVQLAEADAAQDFGVLSAAGVETLNLELDNTGATPTAANAFTVGLGAADHTTVNISGDASAVIDTALTSVKTVDASASTGNVTVDVTGNANDVTMTGGAGVNTFTGGAGKDTIDGGEGNDVLVGGAGADVLIGGAGDDNLSGGAGADMLTGGDGADTFTFAVATDSNGVNVDTITDFLSGTDKLAITTANGNGKYVGEANGYGAVLTAFTGVTDEAVLDTSTNTLYVDVNGDQALDAADIAINLTGVTDLSTSDFIFS